MIRKLFLVPAFALVATLFASESAQAQPFAQPLPGHGGYRPLPGPVVVRPYPGPVVVRPAPLINIGLTLGAPIHTYSVYAPPVIITTPVHNHFRVVFRASCHEPWRTYKIYHSSMMAREVAEEFRFQGYEATVFMN